MTYQEHKISGEGLSSPEVDAALQSLALDERFCAVVAWLERNREAFIAAGSRQEFAGDHGRLAHAQGSVHAVNVLASQLANLMSPGAQGGIPRPEGV